MRQETLWSANEAMWQFSVYALPFFLLPLSWPCISSSIVCYWWIQIQILAHSTQLWTANAIQRVKKKVFYQFCFRVSFLCSGGVFKAPLLSGAPGFGLWRRCHLLMLHSNGEFWHIPMKLSCNLSIAAQTCKVTSIQQTSLRMAKVCQTAPEHQQVSAGRFHFLLGPFYCCRALM